jgi:hypothetical protein
MRPTWPNGIVTGSPARASDIEELRDEINRVREIVGLSPISWPEIGAIKASDLTQMRSAIQDIWNDDDLEFGTLPDWTGHAPASDNLDLAVHIMDLRTWISRASDFPPEQGVDSYSYTPINSAQTNWAVIGSNWRSNIQGFTGGAPDENKIKYVRCKIVAKPDGANRVLLSQDSGSLAKYAEAFGKYSPIRVFALLNLETYRRGETYDAALGTVTYTRPGQPSITVNNTNMYIENFAYEAAQIHNSFKNSGVSDYIIWNEPNDTNPDVQPKHLSAAQFAALLRRCWQNMALPLPTSSRPRLYWGGILFTNISDSGNPQSGQVQYVDDVYSNVRSQLAADPVSWRPSDDQLPWSGINVHLHHVPFEDSTSSGTVSFVKNLVMDNVWSIQQSNGDGGWIIIGEWGVARQDLDDDEDALLKTFQRIRPWSTAMFYFTHPDFDQSDGDDADWWGLANREPESQGGQDYWVAKSDVQQGPKYRVALE